MCSGDEGAMGGTVTSCIVISTEAQGICWWLLESLFIGTAITIEEWETICSDWAVVVETLVDCVGGSPQTTWVLGTDPNWKLIKGAIEERGGNCEELSRGTRLGGCGGGRSEVSPAMVKTNKQLG